MSKKSQAADALGAATTKVTIYYIWEIKFTRCAKSLLNTFRWAGTANFEQYPKQSHILKLETIQALLELNFLYRYDCYSNRSKSYMAKGI